MAFDQSKPTVLTAIFAAGLFFNLLPTMAQEQSHDIGTAPAAQANDEVLNDPIFEEDLQIEDDTRTKVRLNQLRAAQGNITIERSRGREVMYYSIAPQYDLEEMQLHLEFVNSISLVRERSHLRVLNNDSVVAQFALDPDQPKAVADIDIPIETIKPGFNRLTLEVAQHYTESCEDFTAPELWTQIDTERSIISIDGLLAAQDAKVSELDELISPAIGGVRDLAIVSADRTVTNESLEWAGILAQAISLKLRYVMPELAFSIAQQNASPNAVGTFGAMDLSGLEGQSFVLYGTKAQVSKFVSDDIAKQITGAYVGLHPIAAGSEQFALVVSGKTPAEVRRAAIAMSLPNFPFIDGQSMVISELDIPLATAAARTNVLEPDGHYRFVDLNFQSTTLGAGGEQAAMVQFKLPADFYVKESDNVEVTLHFSYGAGFRSDSVINIFLNDEFAQAIALKNEDGGNYRDYKLYLPARAFIPGTNQILFRPAFYSPFGGECITPGVDNLILNVSGRSEIKLPDAQRYAHQPDLEVFQRTGFPYTQSGFGSNVAMLVTDKSEDTVTAALTFLAKVAQVSGLPFSDMWIGFTLPENMKDRHLMIVGPASSIPQDLLQGAPLTFDNIMALPHPTSRHSMDRVKITDYWTDFDAAYDLVRGKRSSAETDPVIIRQTGAFGRNAMIVAFESPTTEGRTVTIVTAETPASLRNEVQDLVTPKKWAQLKGDLAVWRSSSDEAWSQRAGKIFYIGKINPFELMRYHLARAPWWWIFGIGLTIIVLASSIRGIIRERQRLKDSL